MDKIDILSKKDAYNEKSRPAYYAQAALTFHNIKLVLVQTAVDHVAKSIYIRLIREIFVCDK